MLYDLIIIGGSAAATAAGVYAARRGLNVAVVTKEFGGEVATSGEIANWPGIIKTDGIALAQQFKEHLLANRVPIQEGVEVERVIKQDDGAFCVSAVTDGVHMANEKVPALRSSEGAKKCDLLAKTVIVATGLHPRELSVPGEKEYRGKGVSYCTVCDGPLFGGKVTAVIGGGNSALEAGLMLADIASQVYVINKNPQFKGEKVLLDNLNSKKNVQIIYSAMTTEIFGDQFVRGLRFIRNGQPRRSGEVGAPTGMSEELKVDGVFVHIGQIPNCGVVPPEVAKDEFGQIKVNANCETNVPGLYAAGDVTDVPFKQIVIASAQGCIAALSAVQYLNRLEFKM